MAAVLLLPFFQAFVALTVLLVYFAFIRKRQHPNYPPGPPGLPFIGNIHQLGQQPHLTLTKWAKEYGKIFSVKLGMDDAIVINDPMLIKELFGDTASAGRAHNEVFLALSEGKHGIINAEGEHWEEQRRFALRKLRDFGFAKSSMEGMILEEANTVLEWLQQRKGAPVSCHRIFNAAVVNSLWHIVSGERSEGKGGDENKSEILKKSDLLMQSLQTASQTGLLFAPFLRFFAPDISGWSSLMNATMGLNRLCEESIVRHKKVLNSSSPQDLIDHYLIEMDKTKDSPNSSFFREAGVKNLKATVVDLFEAGNETTANTLSWALLYLSHHPFAQEKLINEIQTVVGQSRLPSLTDRVNLPYTEAVIMEVLRYSALVPMGVMHRMTQNRMFHGYYIPKDTIIISNLHACLHSPEIWGDPENFRPERFLSENGSKVIRNDALIPFSVGRRVCLGESLAKDTLFLFMTSIFQKLKVYPDSENPKPDFEPLPGFVNLPKPFNIVVKEHA